MEADRTELNNLAEEMPGKVKKMVAEWQAWADRVGVQPWVCSCGRFRTRGIVDLGLPQADRVHAVDLKSAWILGVDRFPTLTS
jgi:hypothetical protein